MPSHNILNFHLKPIDSKLSWAQYKLKDIRLSGFQYGTFKSNVSRERINGTITVKRPTII